jgi:hypothetical protein
MMIVMVVVEWTEIGGDIISSYSIHSFISLIATY